MRTTIDGCQLLANAIIAQAVDDYIDCLIDWNLNSKVNKAECESFFRSEWFMMLTDADGKRMINTCKKMASTMKNLQFDIKKISKKSWGVFQADSPDEIIKDFETKRKATAYAAELQGIPVRYFVKGLKLKALKAGGCHR